MSPTQFAPEQLAMTFLAIFSSDLARYLIGAGGVYLIINLLLSRALQGRKIRSTSPDARQIANEFLSSMRTVLVFACIGMSVWFADQMGWLLIYREPDLYGWGWFIASLILLIVLHDCWFYWMHWLLHRSKLFRRFHIHHHQSNNPSPFTAYSFSVGEAILTALYFPLVLAIVPASGLAAFLFTAHMMLVNAIHHCGYEIYPRNRHGTPLFDWLTTTTHHDLHHAHGRWNFGFYFTHWDRWMGTEHPQYHEKFSQASARSTSNVSSKKDGRSGKRRWSILAAMAIITIASTLSTSPKVNANELEQSLEMRSITGTWVSEGYAFILRFGPCSGSKKTLCGELQWAWNPETITQEAWHRPMLKGFIYRDGYWRNGTLTHPQKHHIYHGKLQQNDMNTLTLQGCVALLFCDKQIWRRLESLPHATGFKQP